MTRDTWIALRDAIYVVEAAARDAEMDLAALEKPGEAAEIVRRLVGAIEELAAASIEPKAVRTD